MRGAGFSRLLLAIGFLAVFLALAQFFGAVGSLAFGLIAAMAFSNSPGPNASEPPARIVKIGCGAWGAVAVVVIVIVIGIAVLSRPRSRDTYVVERTEYHDPQQADALLADDRLEHKHPAWDESLVDSRPLGDWEVNQSAAVIRLDCPAIKPDVEGDLLLLRPSYAEAMKCDVLAELALLPSANLLDGAAKQFDDGLYAAVDLACYRGELAVCPAPPELIQKVFGKLPAGSPARPFLAGALQLAGRSVPLAADEEQKKRALLREFEADRVSSKPIGFYDWTPELKELWRFFRFLQREFEEREAAACRSVAETLKADAELRKQYRAINGFYGRLTNPAICLSAEDLIDAPEDFASLAKRRGARHPTVAVFPPSTTRETELHERLFPTGIPAGANLMTALIHRVLSGEVKLKPSDRDGWYQYQVYALETMLLPTRGQESDKLLLTAKYKQRLVEAFKALVTKRRETHVGGAAVPAKSAVPLGQGEVKPRLRIEPCPTFYLRTARAYAFLENLLLAAAGKERLAKIHGLKQGGLRTPDLAAELRSVRTRFYGFYLLSCEDLGMKPQLLKDEPVDQGAAKDAAVQWLADLPGNPDLGCDTRVSVPIYVDPLQRKTRFWATLGVRLVKLEAEYASPPKVRPKKEGGAWKEVEWHQRGTSHYVIPVDEFAEFELPSLNTLTRAEFRALCDRCKTKEEILQSLARKR